MGICQKFDFCTRGSLDHFRICLPKVLLDQVSASRRKLLEIGTELNLRLSVGHSGITILLKLMMRYRRVGAAISGFILPFQFKKNSGNYWTSVGTLMGISFASGTIVSASSGRDSDPEAGHVLVNWSGTHEARPCKLEYPESEEEILDLVQKARIQGAKIRVMGSGLSPNAIGFSDETVISLAMMDKVISVDEEKRQVRVQAGIRVEKLTEALKEYGLTLQNFASIAEQQLGGFYQVSAHGTGATIPPVDEQIVSMRIITPDKGILELSESNNPQEFFLARVGLGSLGIVSEFTIQCVQRHKLLERTFTLSRKELRARHAELVRSNHHIRYMWIPYTDTVVVVTCNPVESNFTLEEEVEIPRDDALRPLRNLLDMSASDKNFAQLRGLAIVDQPLNAEHIAKVNQAEAEFWKLSSGSRVDWSENILGFECGDQQWVSEVAFPVKYANQDIEFVEQILSLIEAEKIPAPSPIEQRWTSGSRSMMSPAHSLDPQNSLFSWVGIIMYLPTQDENLRKEITSAFLEYRKKCHLKLWEEFEAVEHWAKIEIAETHWDQEKQRERLQKYFPVEKFNRMRQEVDSKSILANNIITKLFDQVSK